MTTDGTPDRTWDDPDHAARYLAGPVHLPHRDEGEAVVVESLVQPVDRVLDLGTGDGRLLAVVLDGLPAAGGVALDNNEAMLAAAGERFGSRPDVEVVAHDLDTPLPESLGTFDAIVSALVIHHFDFDRRRALYGEILERLRPGGVFADLDLVRSSTEALHDRFIDAGPWERSPDKAWDRHPTLADRLGWTEAAGFEHVDCTWKWRELALVVGQAPG